MAGPGPGFPPRLEREADQSASGTLWTGAQGPLGPGEAAQPQAGLCTQNPRSHTRTGGAVSHSFFK